MPTPITPAQFAKLSLDDQREYRRKFERLEELERRDRARNSLRRFVEYFNPTYKVAWFQDLMCQKLTDFVNGRIKRLIISLGPGRGKSEYVSRYTPAFAFGVNPEARVIACSYGADLASSFNRDVQKIMLSEEYSALFPKSALGQKRVSTVENQPLRNSDIFEIVGHSGFYKSAGVGGAITGRRFSLGFIDDYVKGFEEANSPTYREKIWNWYKTDFYSRRLPDAGICIVATRWHEEDLIGRLLTLAKADPKADQWEVISLPEIVETEADKHPYDPRKVGELLWPERYDMNDYIATRKLYDTYQFNALYQGRPTAREGNVFKRAWYLGSDGHPFDTYPLNGQVEGVRAYWDLGASDNPNADETSGGLMLKTKTNEFYVLEVKAGNWNPSDCKANILRTCLRWNTLFPNLIVDLEDSIGLGVAFIQELHKELLANGINARTDKVRQSKVDRATGQKGSFLSASQNGMIRFCSTLNGDWIEPTLLQLSRLVLKETASGVEFTGDHDDRLDCLVGCFNKLSQPKSNPIVFF